MDTNSLKVYVVDDEPSIVEWLVNKVEWEVYNCEVAGFSTDAGEALRYLEETPVDLLLTDVCMPGLSGLELIRRVKEKYADIFVIVISAYDKFEYVKEAFQYGIIDYCLKPIDVNELYECLKSAEAAYGERKMNYQNQDIMVFRNSIFQRLINGETNSFRLDEQCELAGIGLNVPVFQVVLLDLRHVESMGYSSVMNRFAGLDRAGFYCFMDRHMNLVLLFLGENGYDDEAERDVREVLRREGIWQNTFICVGRQLNHYRHIAENYQVCHDFLEARFLLGKNIIRTQEYPYEKYLAVLKNKELQQLEGCLKMDSREGVLASMEKLVSVCRREEEREAELICLAVFLVKNLRILYPYRKIPVPDGHLETQGSSGKMLKWLGAFYTDVIRGPEGQESVHPYVERALKQIRHGYGDHSLSLQEMAKQCHVSAAYLGKLFREQTGDFFNDYLLKVRLEAACQLLMEDRLRIGAIAAEVGFSSQSYFNKMFRKSYGIPPAEYRRRI